MIRTEKDGTISFGDYTLDKKEKLDNFEHDGDLYKVKTFHEITKLERNGMFVYESVPGTAVTELSVTDNGVSFSVEGPEDAQITLELEENAEYEIFIDGSNMGKNEDEFRRKVKPERRVRCSQPGSCQSGKMLKERQKTRDFGSFSLYRKTGKE